MLTSGLPNNATGDRPAVRLDPWGTDDFALLEQLNSPEMTAHLGGPESPAQLADRQSRYVRLADAPGDRMFKIALVASGQAVGSVGYWERAWRGARVYEMGWGVLPAFQGRGIARAATLQAIARAKADGAHQFLHAFPGVDNPPSNALCRALGFTLVGACDYEYPPGSFMRCNDWCLDLLAGGSTSEMPGVATI